MDQQLKSYAYEGATANVAYLDHKKQKLFVANAGDSRCLVAKGGEL